MRELAVFTIAKDAGHYLPAWLRHHARLVDSGDLYVLDHRDGGPSTNPAVGGFNCVQVHHSESFDHVWLLHTVRAFQRFLLQSYRWVLFCEVDELISPDPYWPDPRKAMAEKLSALVEDGYDGAYCVGYEVVHQPEEPPIVWDAPLLAQRSVWSASSLYRKPLLARVPTEWTVGFHSCTNDKKFAPAVVLTHPTHLYLVHLHRIDYDYCLARNRRNAAMRWTNRDVESGCGLQNRIVDEATFRRWFYHPEQVSPVFEKLQLSPIPSAWRALI